MLKDKLNGLRISLVDETIIEDFGFLDDSIIATIGTKDGAKCAPILEFEITSSDSLVIDKEDFNIQWSQIMIEEDSIKLIRNDVPATYEITTSSAAASKRKLPWSQ